MAASMYSFDYRLWVILLAMTPPPDDDPDDARHKDIVIPTRVPRDVADLARQRAKQKQRTLADIIRSFLTMWSHDEFPTPPPVNTSRAPQRPTKKKSTPPAKSTTKPPTKKRR